MIERIDDIDALRARFPRTIETLLALPEGEATLTHVAALERDFGRPSRFALSDEGGPDRGAHTDFDVVLAGGGLSLVYAAYLARRGLKVAVFDRRRIGCGHREWNISRAELTPLTKSGLFDRDDIEQLLLTEYRTGICRWHGGGTHPVEGVLDCVVDAERLLEALRSRAVEAGATLLDHHAFTGYRVGAGGILVQLQNHLMQPHQAVEVSARLFIDGLGAASPHAAFDLCCPTVGGVLTGLDEGAGALAVDPTVGEILVTTEGVEEDRQHIWEGFPAPGGRFTTYLFYYTEPARLPERPLFSLYERFFATLPRYKRGEARMARATYGFIPAYSRLRPMPTAPCDRVILVGDAAGRHSPLTFCGFGSMIRSFLPVADALRGCLADDRLDARSLEAVWAEPPSLGVMGGLTLMMVPGRRRPGAGDDDVNRLLDAAFSSLAELGNDAYAAFVRDQIGFRDFIRFMQRTARKRPTIYDEVFAQLTPKELARWTLRLARLGVSKWSSG
jgi:lycopene cyclase CruA